MTIGARIAKAREDRGWNQSELARALDVTPQTVQQWEKGGGVRQKRVAAVAKALGVRLDWLMFGIEAEGNGHQVVRETPLPYGQSRGDAVPVFPMLLVEDWILGREPTPEQLVRCPVDISPRGFAVHVTGASMEPRFHKDDVVFIDPERAPANGRLVLVIPAPFEPAMLRQVVTEGGERFLRVLNPDWPGQRLSPLPAEATIAGTVVGTWTPEP